MGRFDQTTQFYLTMTAGLIAIGFLPIGVVRLFPWFDDKRQLWSGLLFAAIGTAGFIVFAILLAPR